MVDKNGEAHDAEIWDFAIKVNLSGTFHLTRLFVEHMVKHVEPLEEEDGERGVVIMVASAAAVSSNFSSSRYFTADTVWFDV